jgi:hypothetical protein
VLNAEFPNYHREASRAHLGVGEGENDFGRVVDVDAIYSLAMLAKISLVTSQVPMWKVLESAFVGILA